MYGINETIDLLEFGFSFSTAIQESLKDDGKVNFNDVLNFMTPLLKNLPKAIAGIQEVPKEWADLDEVERAEIVAYFSDRFDLKDEELELLIEKSLDLLIELVDLVKDIKMLKA